MNPIKQTKFGHHGNCYAACLASILEIPIEAVPNVDDGEDWLEHIDEWLQICHGYTLLSFHAETFYCVPAVHHIMIGKSSRGLNHAVVGFQGKIVHDPHPNNKGLITIEGYEFLLPLEK